MNIPYIQAEIFRELVGMETLLKPNAKMGIVKFPDGNMRCDVWMDSMLKATRISINVSGLQRCDDITQAVNKIWEEIPAEYKKENLVL